MQQGHLSNEGKNFKHILGKLDASQTIILGFLLAITIGTILLMLPVATQSRQGTNLIDALFVATSALSVTGLSTVNTAEHWSVFGKIVILFLIQIGGLGFMTIVTLILILLGKKITLKDRLAIQASFNQHSMKGMVKLVKSVIKFSLTIEMIGAIILTFGFFSQGSMSLAQSAFAGVFYAVSAFCNAGFGITPVTETSNYVAVPIISFTIMFLAVVGGIGFTVWQELKGVLLKKINNETHGFIIECKRLSLHSKMTLTLTAGFLLFGTLFFFLAELSNEYTIANMSMFEKVTASAFQSVNTRSSGFSMIDQYYTRDASKFIATILMFIGASPAGTGGGVKTVTMGLLIASAISIIRGREGIVIFERSIQLELLQKSLSIIFMVFTVNLIATILLSFTERSILVNYQFIDLLFEVFSASGTVGLSVGITSYLSTIGKLIIIVCMFIGRIGPMTMILALTMKLSKNANGVKYPTEKVLVG